MESTVFLCKENCGKKVSDKTAWKWQKGKEKWKVSSYFLSLYSSPRGLETKNHKKNK